MVYPQHEGAKGIIEKSGRTGHDTPSSSATAALKISIALRHLMATRAVSRANMCENRQGQAGKGQRHKRIEMTADRNRAGDASLRHA